MPPVVGAGAPRPIRRPATGDGYSARARGLGVFCQASAGVCARLAALRTLAGVAR